MLTQALRKLAATRVALLKGTTKSVTASRPSNDMHRLRHRGVASRPSPADLADLLNRVARQSKVDG